MREDPTKTSDFLKSQQWAGTSVQIFEDVKASEFQVGRGTRVKSNSFSGNERNRLFMQRDGNFDDLSLISGADFLEDGRSIGLLDYDGDGWMDMAVSSTSEPRFRLMKNQLGSLQESGTEPRFVKIKLVGGNESAEPQKEWSTRDGIGAKVFVHRGEKIQLFQHSCGEGLGGQNSSTMHVGLGQTAIDSIQVAWPSGKESIVSEIKPGDTITIRERGE